MSAESFHIKLKPHETKNHMKLHELQIQLNEGIMIKLKEDLCRWSMHGAAFDPSAQTEHVGGMLLACGC